MSAAQVSRYVRAGIEARYTATFNTLLAAACTEFGIAGLAYAINFSESEDGPQNFYRGDRSIESLAQTLEPELPALAMWTGEGQNQNLQMPRMYSGFVAGYWRFFLFVQGIRTAGLVDLREATEAAMIQCLDPEGLGYRGDIGWRASEEQQYFDQDENHRGWLQVVDYSASFEVNI